MVVVVVGGIAVVTGHGGWMQARKKKKIEY